MQVSTGPAMPLIQNVPFDEISVGDSASLSRTLTEHDIQLFAVMSGDVNPAHLSPEFASQTLFKRVVGHGMWTAALLSNLLGTQLPGPGTIYLGQNLRFHRPVHVGDTVRATITVREKLPEKRRVIFDCQVVNQQGERVVSGTAEVIAPTEKIRSPRPSLPDISFRHHGGYEHLLAVCRERPPIRVAVAHPCDVAALGGALDAAEEGLIEPVLVGPRARIEAAARELGADIQALRLVETEHSVASAKAAVALARRGEVDTVMKGSLHTDELLAAILDREQGLRTGRRLSHVYVMAVPSYPRPLLVTDAAINVAPDLEAKRDICQNVIDLARTLGIRDPRVALLSAVETVNAKMESTLHAAALCKMADRGQIQGGRLDGPLAFDNAISTEAARIKGIDSPVAGQADVLLVPDLVSGNILVKQLIHLSEADAAGIVLGARVPVILTSRSDKLRTRLASCAVAVILAQRHSHGPVSVSNG